MRLQPLYKHHIRLVKSLMSAAYEQMYGDGIDYSPTIIHQLCQMHRWMDQAKDWPFVPTPKRFLLWDTGGALVRGWLDLSFPQPSRLDAVLVLDTESTWANPARQHMRCFSEHIARRYHARLAACQEFHLPLASAARLVEPVLYQTPAVLTTLPVPAALPLAGD